MEIIEKIKELQSSKVTLQIQGIDISGCIEGKLFVNEENEDEETMFGVKNKSAVITCNVDDISYVQEKGGKITIILEL
jgi:hypothetical protein